MSPLVTQISWANHLLILSGAKSTEEKEFYISLCAKEKYSKRELERQINSAYYQRYMLSTQPLASVVLQSESNDYWIAMFWNFLICQSNIPKTI